jgi:hypothetical protein
MLTIKGLPMLVGLVILVRLARRRERTWFAHFSATFHDDGAVTGAELSELSGLRARRRARKAALRAKGPMGEQLKGQIQREQMTLVQLMSKHRAEDDPAVAVQQAKVHALKAQYEALAGPTPWSAQPTWVQPAPVVQPLWTQPGAAAGQPGWQPAPAVQPAWSATHRVPDGGLPAWPEPDPSKPIIATLSAGLEVAVAERAADWARVVAVNGWTGWVDARRLAPVA